MFSTFDCASTCRITALALLLIGGITPGLQAAVTDISSEPVITQLSGKTKPNLMFVLDDSGSMQRTFMPDEIALSITEELDDTKERYAYWASHCNGVAYDPTKTYLPPVKADGTSYPAATYPKALVDGYNSGSADENLDREVYYTYKGAQKRLDWTYDANGQPNKGTTFYQECMSDIGKGLGRNVFDEVEVKRLSTEKRQNYANWFSYYRARYLMMRSAVGLAMQKFDSNTRVGFSRINRTNHVDNLDFRDVKPFDATQKTRFYDSLYKNELPQGGTPLRGALSRVGRYYAKRLSGQTYDPVEYACQRNYALVTTDGYWNSGGSTENSNYGPLDLFGNKVGQQDANEVRPMKDVFSTRDTMADVAQYYYATDLRTPALNNCASKDQAGNTTDVCDNIVPGFGRDLNTSQHLTTFAIGFGVSGTLKFDQNYLSETTVDYSNIVAGSKDWPATTTTINSWSGDARNIDDLWHAAVNGRGQYYSALDSSSLSEAIQGVAATIADAVGSASAASFNTLVFSPDDNNRVYQATFTSHSWTGDIKGFSVEGSTGALKTELWSATASLDARSPASRTIWYRQSHTNGTLRSFVADNLSDDGYISHFKDICAKTGAPSQCTTLSPDAKNKANIASNFIDYLRGDRTFETTNTADPLYRTRLHLLGDIIRGAPVYVGKPPLSYTDAGYAAFVNAQKDRRKMVYAGANDGMLHAFDAETGEEVWAYIPTEVMPNLYKLAEANYHNKHVYTVDGEPVVGDILVGGVWKTILVGGLGKGGRAYYALDITDPANPKSLWEFSAEKSDANLGLSYGNPVITKRADGTWVVAFTSGLNNVSAGNGSLPAGDGLGRLFILNANTGVKLLDIPTTAGSTATPSGLMGLNAWVEVATNNTALRFYAADLLGNVWRFDTDSLVQPFEKAQLIAQLQTPAGAQQPVTTRPELLSISENGVAYPVVVVGTGRYLGSSDIGDNTLQSIYALKDPMNATGWSKARDHQNIVKTTVAVTGATANATNVPVNWASQIGWYFDLPNSGERMITPMSVQSTTLALGTTLPNSGVCSQGGASWFYRINMTTGLANPGIPFGMQFSSSALIIGLSDVKLSNGTSGLYLKDSTGKTTFVSEGVGGKSGTNPPRRSSWRELVN